MPINYDKKAKRYRDAKGRFISNKSVRREIERMQLVFKREARKLSKRLEVGKISVKGWQRGMQNLIKNHHTIASSIGKGGWKQMGKADWLRTARAIKKEYRYLNNFANLIRSGKLSAKQIANRAGSYSAQLNSTFTNFQMDEQDAIEARRTLHAAESCPECVDYADEWIAIDEMPKIGTLICGSHCRCSLEYR